MTDIKPVFHTTDEGRRTALLVKQGPKHKHLVLMDSAGLRVTMISAETETPEIKGCKDPLSKFQVAAKQFGITKTAALLIGLPDGIPTPRGQEQDDVEDTAPPRPSRKKAKKPAEPKQPKAKKEPAPKAESSPRGQSKEAFVSAWNRFASGELTAVQAKAVADKTWQIGEARAAKRWARLCREHGVTEDSPKAL